MQVIFTLTWKPAGQAESFAKKLAAKALCGVAGCPPQCTCVSDGTWNGTHCTRCGGQAVPPPPACGVDEYLGLDGKCHKKSINAPGKFAGVLGVAQAVKQCTCGGKVSKKCASCIAQAIRAKGK